MLARNAAFGASIERAASVLVRVGGLEPGVAHRLGELDLATAHYPSACTINAPLEPPHLLWVLDGWACEARDLADGRRQIFSFVVPGDVVRPPDPDTARTLRAMTAFECVEVGELLAQAGEPEPVLQAVSDAAALANARKYEHLSRLAWRSAVSRMASLLIELHDRLEAVGLVRSAEFALPVRHEDLADALGLSPAHVTRCLGTLRDQGLLTFQFRRVSGFDRDGLAKFCLI